ncbi:MAG: IS1595 family transposase, partial [Hyphomonadaceae bacterium]|nr:IS1595 family transposase [Hyphomonadaceae bacterium]
HRTLGVSKKTAWFLMHRIRESLRPADDAPMGSGGGSVEVDETYFGVNPNAKVGKRRNLTNQNRVVTLVDRDTGRARSLLMSEFSKATLAPVLEARIAQEARLLTDEASVYKTPGKAFAAHKSVKHGVGEYVSKKDRSVHTNTVESYFSTFKRGMRGIYQHCSADHLHRYVAEFDYRYSNRMALGVDDQERFERSVPGIVGKRLTYRRTRRAEEGAQSVG